jgi:DNA-binding MarR family transcriptional regulator
MTDSTVEPASPTAQRRSADEAQIAVSNPRGLETWRVFLQAHATVVRRLEAELEAAGQISLADLDVLIQLASAPGDRLRMSELADTVLLSRSGMTRRIDRLEDAGFVQRHECTADRRGAYAAITAAGLDRLTSARPTHLRGVEEHFVSRLTEDELASVRGALTKLIPADDRPSEEACS